MRNDIEFKLGRFGRYEAYVDTVRVAHARTNGGYISHLWVKEGYRRQGIATALINFVIKEVGHPLNRCPDERKNTAVKSLSKTLNAELFVD